VIRAVIDGGWRLGVVDPNNHDYGVYRGATLITPNAKELAAAVHRPLGSEAEIAEAAAELARAIACEAVLVTRSEEGMTLHVAGETAVHVPA
jgi:D-beta-D-heptose 7-phosphate kinase / D-beta-D-heptose 1-phosphate adenosyltransferase